MEWNYGQYTSIELCRKMMCHVEMTTGLYIYMGHAPTGVPLIKLKKAF
jgi:hypothetical protein